MTLLVRCPNHHINFPLGLLRHSCILGCTAVASHHLPICLLTKLFCTCELFYLAVYWKCERGVESPQGEEETNSKTAVSHICYLTNRQYEKELNIYRSSNCCHHFSLFSSSWPANSIVYSFSELSVSCWEEGSSSSCLGCQNSVLFSIPKRGEQALLLH